MQNHLLIFSILLSLTASSNLIFSQNIKNDRKTIHHEVIDDVYVAVDRSKMLRSPAYTYQNSTIFTTQVNIDAGGNNIVGDAGNEPSIAVDPTNPNRMVIGWRQFDDVNSNFRQAGHAYTTDGGSSWTFPGSIDPGVFRSDPVLDFDAEGNFYYNSLSVDEVGVLSCHVYKIDDGGVEWDEGTYAFGGDKQWMRIDRTEGIGAGNIYEVWSAFAGVCPPGSFSRSTNAGASYEDCEIVSGNPMHGTLAVGPAGELYIAGRKVPVGIVVSKSTTAQDPDEDVTWDFNTTVNLDGNLVYSAPVNPQGLCGQVWVDTDKSDGAGQGNVYVLATIGRISNADPADVMFARSTDGGVSFEPTIRVNTDVSTSNYQWFGTMSVAPNGRIDVIWLDTRDAPTNSPDDSALFYSFSDDQGDTWSEDLQISDYFDPHIGYPNQNKMGDYFDMVSDDSGAHLAWANTLNGGQDVYYSFINPNPIGIDEMSNLYSKTVTNYPNPFSKETTIVFSINKETVVSIEIFDVLGKKVKDLVNSKLDSGKQFIKWDGSNDSKNKLSSGLYYYRIKAGNNTITKKMFLSNK